MDIPWRRRRLIGGDALERRVLALLRREAVLHAVPRARIHGRVAARLRFLSRRKPTRRRFGSRRPLASLAHHALCRSHRALCRLSRGTRDSRARRGPGLAGPRAFSGHAALRRRRGGTATRRGPRAFRLRAGRDVPRCVLRGARRARGDDARAVLRGPNHVAATTFFAVRSHVVPPRPCFFRGPTRRRDRVSVSTQALSRAADADAGTRGFAYGAYLSTFDAGASVSAWINAGLLSRLDIRYGEWGHVPLFVRICAAASIAPLGLLFAP